MTRWRAFNERIAVFITMMAGTMEMFWALVGFYVGWILLQILLGAHAFDAYPYPLLLFVSNTMQLWWLPVITVGQGILARSTALQQHEMHRILANEVSMMEAMLQLAKNQETMMKNMEVLIKQDIEYSRETRDALSLIDDEFKDRMKPL